MDAGHRLRCARKTYTDTLDGVLLDARRSPGLGSTPFVAEIKGKRSAQTSGGTVSIRAERRVVLLRG